VEPTLLEVDVPVPFVAVVALARPPVNALGREIREELVQTFDSLQDRQDVRAIVLTGRGKVFCAGADIKEKQALVDADGEHLRANRLTRDAFYCVLDSRKPVIAAVNGAALGAGFVLASCCDMIFAAESAVFGMPEIDVGLGGGASFLQRILPRSKLRRMMLTGERIPAAELYRLGAVEGCVPPPELLPAALAVATMIASKSPAAVQRIRDSFATVEALPFREGFRLEQNYTTELSKTPDAKEARRAFLEKRKPAF
jgi:enoyl-CoA hydratase